MNTEIVQALLHLNRQFYQTFALQFSADRQRLQPGVQRVLATLPREACLLDLGCGNGELAHALALRGQQGLYVGLDFSPELIQVAKERNQDAQPVSRFERYFLVANLEDPDWASRLQIAPLLPGAGLRRRSPAPPHPCSPIPYPLIPFDFVLAFAVLHHLPGEGLRVSVLRKAYQLLAPSGQLIHSEWQFLNSDRLRARLQPWDRVGLDQDDVDPGDYLMDWRHGGEGLRYVHHFSTAELTGLAVETGFTVKETFLSDGEGGQLGLYQVWEKPGKEH